MEHLFPILYDLALVCWDSCSLHDLLDATCFFGGLDTYDVVPARPLTTAVGELDDLSVDGSDRS